MIETKTLENVLKLFSTKDVSTEMYRDASSDNFIIGLYTKVKMSNMELMRDKGNALSVSINELRDNLLNSRLFESERNALLEYKRLKNMKFVIDGLKTLDLEKLQENQFRGFQDFYERC